MEVRRAADLANIFYVRQKETKGLGHAIGRARRFVGDEPLPCCWATTSCGRKSL